MSRVIDFHVHVWPDAVAPKALAALANGPEHLAAFSDGTVAGLVGAMDAAGIDISVTQPVATKASQVRSINDWAASTASDRVVPFGAMHPEFENPVAELARMHALGLRGFKMHPEEQDFSPEDPRLGPILGSAAELGMAILFHAGEDSFVTDPSGTPEAFARMLDAYPDTTVILAHMGGWRRWAAVLEHLAGRPIYLDTAYTLGYLPNTEFLELVRAHGAHRVLFGSDAPWIDLGAEIQGLGQVGFTAEELDGILGGNAERLLGL